jgi:CRP-like cAMP-binding protein
MAIEKCINEFDVDDVIFEEGSTGRELFVVLEGSVEIAKVNGASKTVIVTLGKGEFFQSLERLKGLNSKILLSGHGRLSDAPQDDVRIAIQRSHGLLSDTAHLFDALDARSNFEPIMQSVRDLNKLDDA